MTTPDDHASREAKLRVVVADPTEATPPRTIFIVLGLWVVSLVLAAPVSYGALALVKGIAHELSAPPAVYGDDGNIGALYLAWLPSFCVAYAALFSGSLFYFAPRMLSSSLFLPVSLIPAIVTTFLAFLLAFAFEELQLLLFLIGAMSITMSTAAALGLRKWLTPAGQSRVRRSYPLILVLSTILYAQLFLEAWIYWLD